MAEKSSRTLVCSVLFLDLIGYSKRTVTEQEEIKTQFNVALAEALDLLNRRDRVIVDTGDGAAVVFMGDPEEALIAGLSMREHSSRIAMRMGINLGPIRLVTDLNEQVNVIGDGINAAQRVMSFSEPGQLLVSSSYFEVVSRVSDHYRNLFTREGRRQDKHVREHEVYSVADSIHLGGQSLIAESVAPAVATAVYRPPEGERRTPALEPAKVHDAGPSLMISGSSRASVQEALQRLLATGASLVAPVAQVGGRWIASCTHASKDRGPCTIEQFGLKRVVSGPSLRAVADKAAELTAFGATQIGEIEMVDGVWSVVLDTHAQ